MRHIDLHADEAINITALLASALDSDIDDPDIHPTAPQGQKTGQRYGGAQKTTKKEQKWAMRPK